MSITYKELKKRILLKIDEYEADVDQMTEDEDIIVKMPDAVNEAIRFVFYGKSQLKTWNVEQGASFNALESNPSDPDTQKLSGEHRLSGEGGKIEFVADNACCYYFEVDDSAQVDISVYDPDQDVWSVLKTESYINEQPFSEFKSFKGRLNTTGTHVTAKLTFYGDYYYRYRNVCLHNVAYDSDDKVPDYTGFRQHDIPKNLYRITQAYRVADGEKKNVSFYTEGNKLYLPDVQGVIYLVSKFFPDPVSEETTDDYVIDIPIETEWTVVAKAAAILQSEGEYEDLIGDEEQYMQMIDMDAEKGHSGVAKIVRLH